MGDSSDQIMDSVQSDNTSPVETLNSEPSEIPNSAPADSPSSVPVDIPNSVPVDIPNSVAVDIPNSVPVDTPNSVPVDIPNSVSVESVDSTSVKTESCLPVKSESSLSTEAENSSIEVTSSENIDSFVDSHPHDKEEVSDTPNDETEKDDVIDDDFEDIDLSAIELATNLIEKMESPEMTAAFKMSDTCENIMHVCSSTAQAIKKTISDVLKSRENIVITAGDTTSELEANLSQKIADFENIVGGCYLEETDLTNIKHPAFSNVIITEVNEPSEDSNLTSNSKVEIAAETKSDVDATVPSTSECNTDSKDVQKKTVDDKAPEIKDSAPNTNKKSNSKDIKNSKVTQIQAEPVQVSTFEDDKNFKKQQKNNSNKKKGEKSIDQILKSLSNCSTAEEKLQALCKKHLETLEEFRLLEPRMRQLERQVAAQQREKEQLQAEHNRMILAKSRLESLCRELQRQNRAVKEESLMHIKAEEERRKEIANKFQVTLSDISTLMQEHSKKNSQLREENTELAKKLKALVDHYDMWEKHMEKVVQQNNLEAQLAKAKHAKVNLLLKQETEKFLREKQSLLQNMSELQKKCTLLTTNELKLRTELGDYTSKYEEFQTVLNKSSQVFATFKNDMEATSKKIKKLEKETNVYKQKWESSNNALLGMVSDKEKHDKELANAHQRILTLEKLCRALQGERNDLRNQIKVISDSTDCSKKDVPSQPAETPVA